MSTISACMIIKNELHNLTRTLPDLIAGVDQVIVVDTGSSDGGGNYAASLGATVIPFQWTNDFSEARNLSLRQATGDWVLWPDADELYLKTDVRRLRQFLDTYNGTALGLPIAECPDGTMSPDFKYYRAKLFKNHIGITFARPFNEQIVLSHRTVMPQANTDIVTVYHWGSLFHLSPENRKKKIQRNREILTELLAKYPSDAGYLYSLAMTLLGMEPPEPVEALALFLKAHDVCPDPDLALLIVYKIGKIMFRLGDFAQLDRWLERMKSKYPEYVPLKTLRATRLMMNGQFSDAEAELRVAIAGRDSHPIPEQVDANEFGSVLYENLGVAMLGQNRFSEAREALQQAITLNPSSAAAMKYIQLVDQKELQCQ